MSSPQPPPLYLTPAEVAEKLRLSPITVIKLCRKKKLPAVKIGGSWRIPSAELDAHLATKQAS